MTPSAERSAYLVPSPGLYLRIPGGFLPEPMRVDQEDSLHRRLSIDPDRPGRQPTAANRKPGRRYQSSCSGGSCHAYVASLFVMSFAPLQAATNGDPMEWPGRIVVRIVVAVAAGRDAWTRIRRLAVVEPGIVFIPKLGVTPGLSVGAAGAVHLHGAGMHVAVRRLYRTRTETRELCPDRQDPHPHPAGRERIRRTDVRGRSKDGDEPHGDEQRGLQCEEN